MPSFIKKLLELLLKDPRGRVGFLVFVLLCVAMWLIYDYVPGQPPLSATEITGMALFNLIVVFIGILAWGRYSKWRGGGRDES